MQIAFKTCLDGGLIGAGQAVSCGSHDRLAEADAAAVTGYETPIRASTHRRAATRVTTMAFAAQTGHGDADVRRFDPAQPVGAAVAVKGPAPAVSEGGQNGSSSGLLGQRGPLTQRPSPRDTAKS